MLLPEFMLDCVVAIGYPAGEGKIVYVGTGFLYGRLMNPDAAGLERRYSLFLVTNRHVLEGQSVAFLRFNPEAASPAQAFPAALFGPDAKQLWLAHTDPDIDVAAIAINANLLAQAKIRFRFFEGDKHVLTQKDASAEGLSEGDSVFVLGFPMGNVGAERNYVVVRQGIVARIRDSFAGAVKQFLIDAAVFPGNSGGPVVTRPEIVSIAGTKAISKCALIGVVSSYLPYQDVAISQQTRRPRIIFEENSGLAAVVPIDRVVEAIELAFASTPPTPAVKPDPAENVPVEMPAESDADSKSAEGM